MCLVVAAVVGGLIGGVIGPFALRLRGNYLAIITLGLVFLGQHVFENWTSVTGGPERHAGRRPARRRPGRLREARRCSATASAATRASST